jgi:hypothetical protein
VCNRSFIHVIQASADTALNKTNLIGVEGSEIPVTLLQTIIMFWNSTWHHHVLKAVVSQGGKVDNGCKKKSMEIVWFYLLSIGHAKQIWLSCLSINISSKFIYLPNYAVGAWDTGSIGIRMNRSKTNTCSSMLIIHHLSTFCFCSQQILSLRFRGNKRGIYIYKYLAFCVADCLPYVTE